MEIWKSIPGFSRYEASNTGLLRSLSYKNENKVKILSPAKTKDGYLKTMLLSDNKRYHSWNVHKFIAITFFGQVPAGLQINHKDGNKLNNHIDNLEYITQLENIAHCHRLGLQKYKQGSENGASKLTEKEVKEIRDYASNFKGRYYGRKQLAEKYGVCECTIKEIVNHRKNRWKHV